MKLIIISALGNEQLKACLTSLLTTTANNNFDIEIIREKEFREVTLNHALKNNKKDDLFIVGDDIIFTEGWFESLEKNLKKGDIIGFPMLYPNTEIIQDWGYDLVKIDKEVSLLPKYRGLQKKRVELQPRQCDFVCGCALFIKKKVFKKLPSFSLDGQNRWGEAIYTLKAKQKGFKVIVLDHFLYHHGKSTKVNKKLKYGTISYQYEKKVWDKIQKKHILPKQIKKKYITKISKKILSLFKNNEKVLIYGIGTVAERISKYINTKKIDFCTGLKEEEGISFYRKKTKYYKKIDFGQYDVVLITPLNMEKVIYSQLKPKLKKQNKTYFIHKIVKRNQIIYDIKEIKDKVN